jgi:hypothetical protein
MGSRSWRPFFQRPRTSALTPKIHPEIHPEHRVVCDAA